MYVIAIIDLVFSILTAIFNFGYFPDFTKPIAPLIKEVLDSPILQVWSSPEKIFLLSYIVIEYMIVHPLFKFPKLIKYNVLLIFALLMIQGLVISYWDLVFAPDITRVVVKEVTENVVSLERILANIFFIFTFSLFSFIYCYFYKNAINAKFVSFPGLRLVTNSITFWLQMKSPVVPYNEDDETDL